MKKPKRWAPSLLAIVVTGCGHGLPARQLSPVEDGYRESPVQIAARLRSKSPQERVTATEMLRIGAKEDRIPTFVDLLATDPDKAVVQEAASGLAQMRSERVARALWNVRGNIRGSRLRALAYALRGKDDALAFSMLKTMSRDPDPGVREGSLGSLGTLKAHRAPARGYLKARLLQAPPSEARIILLSLRLLKYDGAHRELSALRQAVGSDATRAIIDDELKVARRIGRLY